MNPSGGNWAAVSTNIENPLEKPILSLPLDREEFLEKVERYNRGDLVRWQKEFDLIPADNPSQRKSVALATYNRKKNAPSAK